MTSGQLRPEIRKLAMETARAALEKTAGPLNEEEKRTLLTTLDDRIHHYTGRYPLLDTTNELQAAINAAHSAAVATHKSTGHRSTDGRPRTDWTDAPITQDWHQAVQETADWLREAYFQRARTRFAEGLEKEATEELSRAIICSIATIAARMGWPHQTDEDIQAAVTALATGTYREEHEDLFEVIRSTSEQGQDLSSAFAAATGQPHAATDKLYYDSERGYNEDALMFADRTIELAYQLAVEPR